MKSYDIKNLSLEDCEEILAERHGKNRELIVNKFSDSMEANKKKRMRENWYKYHIPNCSNIHRIKKNAIFINNNNSIVHELSKCLGAIMIHKFGDVHFNARIIEALQTIDKEIFQMDLLEDHTDFLTEAVPNDEKNRRVDLVSLQGPEHYEFETNPKIQKKSCISIYI